MLAVIGAMKEEVDLMRAGMTVSDPHSHAGIDVILGDYRGTPLVLAQCGIGKVNGAIRRQMLIDLYQPRALTFSGVAGGLLPNTAIGDLVIASHRMPFAKPPWHLAAGNLFATVKRLGP